MRDGALPDAFVAGLLTSVVKRAKVLSEEMDNA